MSSLPTTPSPQPPQSTIQPVLLADVDMNDTRFQVRSSLDAAAIRDYEQIASASNGLAAFTEQPILWKNGTRYIICDGWHRLRAAANLKLTQFQAQVITGDESSALIAAMKANLKHGLTLKPEEKREACLRTIKALTSKEGLQPSNTKVAQALGLPESSVRSYREQLVQESRLTAPTQTIGKDGKVQTARKAASCKLKPAPASPAPVSPQTVTPSQGAASPATSAQVNRPVNPVPPTPAAQATLPPAKPTDMQTLQRALEILEKLDEKAWARVKHAEQLLEIVEQLANEAGTAYAAGQSIFEQEEAA